MSYRPRERAPATVLAPNRPAHVRPIPLIGDRICGACGHALWDHCQVSGHLPPCCPSWCPGPASRTEGWVGRMLADG